MLYLGSANYELVLNPHAKNTYRIQSVETLTAASAPYDAAGGYKFTIDELYFQARFHQSGRIKKSGYLLDLAEIDCQVGDVTGTGFTAEHFQVPETTYKLTVAYQDDRVGTDTRLSASKFRSWAANIYTAGPPVVYNVGEELKIDRFYIKYGSQSKPNPDSDAKVSDTEDFVTQRYMDTLIQGGAFFDTGSGESMTDFKERGMYMTYDFSKDPSNRDTRVSIHQSCTNANAANMNCLLFAHHKKVVKITLEDGRVTNVQNVEV